MVTRTNSGLRVLIAGCGSIGRRHLAHLAALDNIAEISIFTRNQQCLKGFEKDPRIKITGSLDETPADIAVIANETDKHAATAIRLASRGMHLFIEKPLAVSVKQAEEIQRAVAAAGVKVHIGYNLRFLGIMGRLRDVLADRILGTPYFAHIEAGQFLPDWRPDTDYRRSYSASAARGGGVALDLSHEIDYMRYLFGDPISWQTVKTKVSNLEIDSDDMFDGIYRYAGNFVCTVHLDYLQPIRQRELRITGSNGQLTCDLVSRRMTMTVKGQETVVADEDLFDLAATYPAELYHFLEVVREGIAPRVTLADGIQALRLIEDSHV